MLIPVLYLVYYLGMILAQMPTMLQVNLLNSTASNVHNDLSGMYRSVGNSDYHGVFQKKDKVTGRQYYIFQRDGGRWNYFFFFNLLINLYEGCQY